MFSDPSFCLWFITGCIGFVHACPSSCPSTSSSSSASTSSPSASFSSMANTVVASASTPSPSSSSAGLTYKVVDTEVTEFSDATNLMSAAPSQGNDFYGQDANYAGNSPSYVDNGDNTITDQVTGLMWQKTMSKHTFSGASTAASNSRTGGHSDWRVPTIKELYSLILFNGDVLGDTAGTRRFINTQYFDQPLGNTSAGERQIDAQTWSSTEYRGTTMVNDSPVFGVNFVDGRIKGYPKTEPRTNTAKHMYFRFVRGPTTYGTNSFTDHNDNTVSDSATGLMWMKADSGRGMDWKTALAYCENLNLAGYSNWKLPNIKQLHSIVDYTRSPPTTSSPAIDSKFSTTSITLPDSSSDYPYFWSSTTHKDSQTPYKHAAYIAFGSSDMSSEGDDVEILLTKYPAAVWALTAGYMVILLTTVVANIITISFYLMNRRAQHMISNPYMLSLLVADFLWPLVNVPYNVVHAWSPYWIFGSLACRFMSFFQVAFPDVISLTLCAIAVERYFTIIHPFHTNPMLRPWIAVLSVGLTWLVPFLGNSFLLFAYQLNDKRRLCLPTALEGFLTGQQITTFAVIQSAIFLVGIPSLLFPFCYGQIISKVVMAQMTVIKRRSSASALALMAVTNIVPNNGDAEFANSSTKNKSTHGLQIPRRLPAHSPRRRKSGKPTTPEHRTRVVTTISIAGQVAHFACWAPIVVFQLWHVANNYPTFTSAQLLTFKILTLLASANAAWNSLSYTAVLRHRAHPKNRAASHVSTFSLLALMLRRSSTHRHTLSRARARTLSSEGGPVLKIDRRFRNANGKADLTSALRSSEDDATCNISYSPTIRDVSVTAHYHLHPSSTTRLNVSSAITSEEMKPKTSGGDSNNENGSHKKRNSVGLPMASPQRRSFTTEALRSTSSRSL